MALAKATTVTGRAKAKGRASAAVAVDSQMRYPGASLGPRARRTIGLILDATRQIFLARGYAGTTVDEIARVAGVSRASFYTYFPSKRDVMLELGTNSLVAGNQVVKALGQFADGWTIEELEAWVVQYFAMLDEHGAFAFAWTQAAHDDDEIRRAGTKGHLELCRRMGLALAVLAGVPAEDPVEHGLIGFSLLERSWSYMQLYDDDIDKQAMTRAIARALSAAVVAP